MGKRKIYRQNAKKTFAFPNGYGMMWTIGVQSNILFGCYTPWIGKRKIVSVSDTHIKEDPLWQEPLR